MNVINIFNSIDNQEHLFKKFDVLANSVKDR